jgi:hypothetical protein
LNQKAWCLAGRSIKQIEDCTYVKLNLTDSGFGRFINGQGKHSLQGYAFLEELQYLRHRQCITHVDDDGPALDEAPVETTPSPPQAKAMAAWKRGKPRRLVKKVIGQANPVSVSVDLPLITFNGKVYGPIAIEMPFSPEAHAPVWVKLDPLVLEYVRVAVLHRGKYETSKPRALAPVRLKGVTFRPNTDGRSACYVARRSVGSRNLYKSKVFKVKVHEDDVNFESVKAEAAEAARVWAGRMDDESDHDGEVPRESMSDHDADNMDDMDEDN